MKTHHNRHDSAGRAIEEAKSPDIIPFEFGDWVEGNVEERTFFALLETILRLDTVDTARQTLDEQMAQSIVRLKEFLRSEEQKLNLASPLHRLAQGYSITMEAKTRKVVKHGRGLMVNERLVTRLYDGEIISKVALVNDQ